MSSSRKQKPQMSAYSPEEDRNEDDRSDDEIVHYYKRRLGLEEEPITSGYVVDSKSNGRNSQRQNAKRNDTDTKSQFTTKGQEAGRIRYTYSYGDNYIPEDQLSEMSNIVAKERVIEKPVYINKQYRNVAVQMTTRYVVPPVKIPKKKVRHIKTQTDRTPTPPHIPTPPMTPSPPPAIIIPPPPTPPLIDKSLPPPTKVIQLTKPERPLFYRVGGGWEKVKDKYKSKHYPVTVMDMNSDTVKEKHFVLQSGSRAMREYLERLTYDKCRGKPKSIPNYILEKLYYG